ncbi:hypothetical protein ABQF26_02065 [Mycolicibacterium elephantis]
MELAHQDAKRRAQTITRLPDGVAIQPAVAVNESTNGRPAQHQTHRQFLVRDPAAEQRHPLPSTAADESDDGMWVVESHLDAVNDALN